MTQIGRCLGASSAILNGHLILRRILQPNETLPHKIVVGANQSDLVVVVLSADEVAIDVVLLEYLVFELPRNVAWVR